MDERTPVPGEGEVKSYQAGSRPTPPPQTPISKPEAENAEVRSFEKSGGSSMDPKMAGMLCYLLGWITGLIFFLIEKEERYVRFHAIQSLMWSVGALLVWLALGIFMIVFGIITQNMGAVRSLGSSVLMLLFSIWGVYNFYLWIKLMGKAKKGEWYKLPLVGDKADEVA